MNYFTKKTGGLWSPDPPDENPANEDDNVNYEDAIASITSARALIDQIREHIDCLDSVLSEYENKEDFDETDVERLNDAWSLISSAEEDLDDVDL